MGNGARELIRYMDSLVAGDVERAPAGSTCKACNKPIEACEDSDSMLGPYHIECAYRAAYVRAAHYQERELGPDETAPGRAAARALLDSAKRRTVEKRAGGETLIALRFARR